MSKETFGSYVLSEVHKNRMESERRRRLEEELRKLEAARRADVERRRKKKVEAQKQRIAVLRSFQEKAGDFQRQESRMSDSTETKVEPDLPGELQSITATMKEQLQSFPQEWLSLLSPEINMFYVLLAEVEKDHYDQFHSSRLYWARRQLLALLNDAPQMVAQLYDRAAEAEENIEILLVKLAQAKKRAFFEAQQEEAARLEVALEKLLEFDDKRKLGDEFSTLHDKVLKLLQDIEEVQARDQERRYVMDNVREVFADLGYRAIDLPDEEQAGESIETAPLKLYFTTPEKGAVEMSFGLDDSIRGEFVSIKDTLSGRPDDHPDDHTGEQNLLYNCEQWCRDYNYLLERLAQRAIVIEEKWRVPPSVSSYRALNFSAKYRDEEEQVAGKPKERSKE